MAAKASFYEQEENLQLLCNFLRSQEGPAVREALLMDKRVLYMKGKQTEIPSGILWRCFSPLVHATC